MYDTDNVPANCILLVPSGRCPVHLEGTDVPSLRQWVEKIEKNKSRAVRYAGSVYQYWVRHSYEIGSKEYKEAIKNLEVVIQD